MKRKQERYVYRVVVKNYFYYTVSNGGRLYTNEDGMEGYQNNVIRQPKPSTCMNLFVNGVIQPAELYSVRKGVLLFKSQDPPPKGAPIILQFIEFSLKRVRVSHRKKPMSNGVEYEEE